MRGSAIAFCFCALAAQAAVAACPATPLALKGEWVGQRDGTTVIWTLSEDGRVRADGRGASYEIHGDTLAVRFDPPSDEQSAARPETAIYNFVPDDTATRLLVYGFDLGKQGVLFFRTPAAETTDPVEDAAPEPPPAPPSAMSTATPPHQN